MNQRSIVLSFLLVFLIAWPGGDALAKGNDLEILFPVNGTRLPPGTSEVAVWVAAGDSAGATIDVWSTAGDGEPDTAYASSSSGRFLASGVALEAGDNVVTAHHPDSGASSSAGVVVETDDPPAILATAIAGVEALIENGPPPEDEEALGRGYGLLLGAAEQIGEPCPEAAMASVHQGATWLDQAAGTGAVIADLRRAMGSLGAAGVEVTARRVGDRDPRTDEALATYSAAVEASADVDALKGFWIGQQQVCGLLDGGPRMYALDGRTGEVLDLGFYDLSVRGSLKLPGAPAFLRADLAATALPGKVLVLAPETGQLFLADFEPGAKTQVQALSVGSRRLATAADGKRFAYLDQKGPELRLMALADDGSIAEVQSVAKLEAEALPAEVAVHGAGELALVTLPFEGSIQLLGSDGESTTLPSPAAFPALARFGAAATGDIYVLGQEARVARIDQDAKVLAWSGEVPFVANMLYVPQLDRLLLIRLLETSPPRLMVEQLDGQTLEPAGCLGPELDRPVLAATVSGRDLVLLEREDAGTRLLTVDLDAGCQVIEDAVIDTPFATSLAIR